MHTHTLNPRTTVELMIRPGDIDMSGLLPPDDGAPAKAAPAAAAAATTKSLKTPEIENTPSMALKPLKNQHVRVSSRVSEVLHIARQELQDGGNDLYKFGGSPSSHGATRNSVRGVTTLPTL